MSEADIANLKRVIEHQANMESLWAEPFGRLPTVHETLLKAALRHLHAIIENDQTAAFRAHKIYWDLESEL
jgi:hypothetical protein